MERIKPAAEKDASTYKMLLPYIWKIKGKTMEVSGSKNFLYFILGICLKDIKVGFSVGEKKRIVVTGPD